MYIIYGLGLLTNQLNREKQHSYCALKITQRSQRANTGDIFGLTLTDNKQAKQPVVIRPSPLFLFIGEVVPGVQEEQTGGLNSLLAGSSSTGSSKIADSPNHIPILQDPRPQPGQGPIGFPGSGAQPLGPPGPLGPITLISYQDN